MPSNTVKAHEDAHRKHAVEVVRQMTTQKTRPNTNTNGSPFDAETLRRAMAAIEEKRRQEKTLIETSGATSSNQGPEGI